MFTEQHRSTERGIIDCNGLLGQDKIWNQMALGSNFSSDSSLLPGPGIIYLASLTLYSLICINTDF